MKKAWETRLEILDGIKNYINKQVEVEKLANTRLKICEECPFIDRIGTKCAVPRTGPCCGECGCSLTLKARSTESECPVGKW